METTCGYFDCKRKEARDGKCIFHLQDKDLGEAQEFNSLLPAEAKRMQDDATLPTIDLIGFRFPRPAYRFPSGTNFQKKVNFSSAVFEGEVDFSGCFFSDSVDFYQAKFLGKASFGRVNFWDDATFLESEFSGHVSFENAEFHFVLFSDTKFSNAVFSGARFVDVAFFIDSKFSDNAAFEDTQFLEFASFEDTQFLGRVSFNGAQFSRDATFARSQFLGDVSFYGLKVAGLMTFRSTLFQTEDYQILSSPIKQHASFESIKVDPRGEVRFEGDVCMSRVSLHHTDIRRFTFLDVKWGRLGGRASIMEHGVLEERKRRSKEEMILPNITPEHVHQIYVRLRRNLERSAGRYPEAGDFFINEKEMRILILQEGRGWPRVENLPEWIILKVYGWLALYGESIMRPVFWSVLTVFVFAALKIVFFRLQTTDAKPYLDFFAESVMAFFQMRSEPGLDILERLISVPILGSLFIALKRKFERR